MLYVYTVLYVCTVGRAGATCHPPPIYLNVIHFDRFYNINQLPGYAVIPPMSYGVLNNNMMGVIRAMLYIQPGRTLQFYCTHYFQLCQVFCKINLKTLKHLTNLTNDTIITT